MIVNDSILYGQLPDVPYVFVGISLEAQKILDEMAKGLRENLITDDLVLAKKYLAKWVKEYNRIRELYEAADKVHNQDLRSEESLTKQIQELRNAGQSAQADKLSYMRDAQKKQTEMHYQELQKYVKPSLEASAYIEILGRQVDDLEIAAGNERVKISENEAENIKRYTTIGNEEIDKEEREAIAEKTAEEKKEQEEINKIQDEFWKEAREESKIPWGKIAFGVGLVGLGLLLFSGKKSKKSKH